MPDIEAQARSLGHKTDGPDADVHGGQVLVDGEEVCRVLAPRLRPPAPSLARPRPSTACAPSPSTGAGSTPCPASPTACGPPSRRARDPGAPGESQAGPAPDAPDGPECPVSEAAHEPARYRPDTPTNSLVPRRFGKRPIIRHARDCKEITACTVDRRVVRCARGVGHPAGKACSAGARAHGAIAPGVGGD